MKDRYTPPSPLPKMEQKAPGVRALLDHTVGEINTPERIHEAAGHLREALDTLLERGETPESDDPNVQLAYSHALLLDDRVDKNGYRAYRGTLNVRRVHDIAADKSDYLVTGYDDGEITIEVQGDAITKAAIYHAGGRGERALSAFDIGLLESRFFANHAESLYPVDLQKETVTYAPYHEGMLRVIKNTKASKLGAAARRLFRK